METGLSKVLREPFYVEVQVFGGRKIEKGKIDD